MQALLIRWLIIALMFVAAAASGFVFGLRYEEGRIAVRDRKVQDAAHKALVESIDRGRQASANLAQALDAERAARDTDRRTFERKLHDSRGTITECPQQSNTTNATGSATPAEPNATPSVDARLSARGNELWNDALAAGATAAERGQWLASANAAPGPVAIEDALVNLRENATLLGECRTRESETQAWLRSQGIAR